MSFIRRHIAGIVAKSGSEKLNDGKKEIPHSNGKWNSSLKLIEIAHTISSTTTSFFDSQILFRPSFDASTISRITSIICIITARRKTSEKKMNVNISHQWTRTIWKLAQSQRTSARFQLIFHAGRTTTKISTEKCFFFFHSSIEFI